jgi:hypothetical protein
VNSHWWLFIVHDVRKKVIIATLLEEEKETKIAKFNFLVKIALLPEMLYARPLSLRFIKFLSQNFQNLPTQTLRHCRPPPTIRTATSKHR